MNLQHERIANLCAELRLERIAAEYPALAQKAAEEEASFTEFLERLLAHESDPLYGVNAEVKVTHLKRLGYCRASVRRAEPGATKHGGEST